MTPLASSSLRCENLDVGFKNRTVLTNVNLGVSGRVTALLGPNGSGKSTLMDCLSGIRKPLHGHVFIGDLDVHLLPAPRRALLVATVPQSESIEFPFTVAEVVAMGRLSKSTGFFETQEDLSVSSEALAMADASHLASRPFGELSGGEKQRVLIARAIAQETPYVLLDEPSSHMDFSHQGLLIALLRQLSEAGKTILVAVHDLNWAARAADRAILLSNGSITYDGSMPALLEDRRLDDAYKTDLVRLVGENGRLLVVPTFP